MIYNEEKLESFSQPRSRHEILRARDTQLDIRKALESYFDTEAVERKYNFKPVLVPFLQGSYRNNTHVAKSSDVDVVIRVKNIWKDNREVLPPDQRAKYEAAYSSVLYPFGEFKNDILVALSKHFGADNLQNDQKCIKVLEHAKYGTADVIPCFTYRLYGNFQSVEQDVDFTEGICFNTNYGDLIRNFPRLHNTALSRKCDPNNRAFKETVRMFKNMRDDLIVRKVLYPNVAKSYYIENLLWNVPDDCFNGKRMDIFNQIMSFLNTITDAKLVPFLKCANGVDQLFGPNNWKEHEAKIFFDDFRK